MTWRPDNAHITQRTEQAFVTRDSLLGSGDLAYGWRHGAVEDVPLERFAHGHSIRTRREPRCFDPCAVVERARSRLGERSYHVLRNNCEHFCAWALRDERRSLQVDRVRAAPRVICHGMRALLSRLANRMIPSVFEGYTLLYRTDKLYAGVGYIARMKARDSDEYRWMSEAAGATGDHTGLIAGGARWNPYSWLMTSAFGFYNEDLFGLVYLASEVDSHLSARTDLRLSAQFTSQENDLTVAYRPMHGAPNGLWLRMRYASGAEGSLNPHQWRVLLNYER